MIRFFLLVALLPSVASFITPRAEWSPCRRKALLQAAPRGGDDTEKPTTNVWDSFKKAVYSGVDSVSDLASKVKGVDDKDKDRVEEGYSAFEKSIRKSPGNKLMNEFRARESALKVDKTLPSPPKKRSGFESLKENLYFAVDVLSSDDKEDEVPLKMDRNIPYRRSLAQELSNEDLLSPNPIKRFQAEQEIREKEARRRAQLRNENIRAKKEDLYKLVDGINAAVGTFKSAVDAIPEKVDETEKAIKEAAKFVQSVPDRVDKAVAEVKAIPDKVQETAEKTRKSVESSIDKTKQVVDDVIDIPNKVTRKVEETKKAVVQTKQSIDETVTNTKVFLRLEKPKPKPPKLPPPKPKTGKDIALSVAGGVATGVGKLAWWATKSTATLAWNGAQAALQSTKESSSSTKQEAQATERKSPVKKKGITVSPEKSGTGPVEITGTFSPEKAARRTPEKAAQKPSEKTAKIARENVNAESSPNRVAIESSATDTKDLEKEVADALKLAEESLKKAAEKKDKPSK